MGCGVMGLEIPLARENLVEHKMPRSLAILMQEVQQVVWLSAAESASPVIIAPPAVLSKVRRPRIGLVVMC